MFPGFGNAAIRTFPTLEPPFAPDVAVEVHSNGDRAGVVAKKIQRYLEYGASLVLDVRPLERTIRARSQRRTHVFEYGDIFEHDAMPGFRFSLATDLFDEIDAPQS